LTKLNLTHDLYILKDKKDICDSESSEEPFSDNDKLNNKSKLNFKMALFKEPWGSIYDSVNPQVYKRSDGKSINREYQTLKPYEWSSIIHNYFYALTPLTKLLNVGHNDHVRRAYRWQRCSSWTLRFPPILFVVENNIHSLFLVFT